MYENKLNLDHHYFVPLYPTIRFFNFYKLTYLSVSPSLVECKVEPYESGNVNFKVCVVPINDKDSYQKRTFYTADFITLLKAGEITEKTTETMHIENMIWEEPLCGAAVLRHECKIIVT